MNLIHIYIITLIVKNQHLYSKIHIFDIKLTKKKKLRQMFYVKKWIFILKNQSSWCKISIIK